MADRIYIRFGKQAATKCADKWKSSRYDYWMCDCPNVELRQKYVIQAVILEFKK